MTTNLRQLFLEHVGQTSDNPMMIEAERAEGIYLYGPDGRRWIDLISGVSVSAVGHGNRCVIDAICAQAQDYLHLMVYGEAVESPQVRYAQRIASCCPIRSTRSTSSIRAARRSRGHSNWPSATPGGRKSFITKTLITAARTAR